MLTINNDVHRDSVHEVVGCLADYSPTIKPMAFIGQGWLTFNNHIQHLFIFLTALLQFYKDKG